MIMIFFLSATVLACIAVAFLVPVLLKEPTASRNDRRHKNIEVAKQRLEDLRRSEASNDLELEDTESIRKEIEYGLLVDIDEIEENEGFEVQSGNAKVRQWAAVAVAVLIPISAGILYLAVGEPTTIGIPATDTVSTEVASGDQTEFQINGESISFEQMTQRVLSHLAVEADDVEGWATLAQLFIAQERFAEAAAAYRKNRELSGDSAELLVREADSMAMAKGGDLIGEPEELLMQALQLDPDHPVGLWLAGFAASSRGDFQKSIEYWRRAEETISNEEQLGEIGRLIASAEAEIAQNADTSIQDDVNEGSEIATVRVSVSVLSSVLEQVDLMDPLFIFARAINGPSVPLAVVKKQVKDLPLVVDIDDSLAMIPNMKISEFDEITIVARISRSGKPEAASGDYFGEIGPIRPTDQSEVTLTISERVL